MLIFLSCSNLLKESDDYKFQEPHPAPTYIRILSISEKAIKLEWSPLWDEYAKSLFLVERSRDDEAFMVLKDSLAENMVIDTSLMKNSRYQYRIKAFNQEKSSDYRTIAIHFSNSNQLVTTLNTPNSLNKISFSPDGKYLASNGEDSLLVWSTDSWTLLQAPKEKPHYCSDHFFSYDSKYVAAVADSNIVVREIIGNKIVFKTVADSQLSQVTLSSNGKLLASGSFFGTLRVYNLETKENIWSKDNIQYIYGILFSPKCDQVICCSYGKISILDVKNGETLNAITPEGDILQSPTISPNGSLFGVLSCQIASKKFSCWRMNDWSSIRNTYIRELYHNSVVSIKFNDDNKQILYGDGNLIRIFDLETNQIDHSLSSNLEGIASVGISYGNNIFASADWTGCIKVWSTTMEKKWCSAE